MDLPGLGYEPDEMYVLEDLEQVRAVATPLRVQILDCLMTRARTVREVGQVLGINSTKLYYHVNELERAGLILLVDTEIQSGIQQKYYRSRANYYYVSSALLHGNGEQMDAYASFVAAQLENAARELRRSVVEGVIHFETEEFKISRREVRMTAEAAVQLRHRLEEIDEFVQSLNDPDGELEMAFAVAMFPRASTGRS